MKCIYCGHEKAKVIDSRKKEGYLHRRRECEKCGNRYSTSEYPNQDLEEMLREYQKLQSDVSQLQTWKGNVEKCTLGYKVRNITSRTIRIPKRPGRRRKAG